MSNQNPDNINFEEPLPEWAVAHSNGDYMERGAQLCTRDGRRMGNARVADREFSKFTESMVAHVKTDAGNSFIMTESELKEAFYPPKYIIEEVK